MGTLRWRTGASVFGADSTPLRAGAVRLIDGIVSCGIPAFAAAPAAEPETPEAAPVMAEETWDQAGSGAETRMRDNETAAAMNRFMGACYQSLSRRERGPTAYFRRGKRPLNRWALGRSYGVS